MIIIIIIAFTYIAIICFLTILFFSNCQMFHYFYYSFVSKPKLRQCKCTFNCHADKECLDIGMWVWENRMLVMSTASCAIIWDF